MVNERIQTGQKVCKYTNMNLHIFASVHKYIEQEKEINIKIDKQIQEF